MSASDAARSRTERFTVLLSAEEAQRLTHRSLVSGLNRSDVVRVAIREWPLPADSEPACIHCRGRHASSVCMGASAVR